MKKILLSLLISLCVVSFSYGASKTYTKNCLTGGTSNCIDSIDGDTLADGDRGIVITTSNSYFYYLDASSGATESSPDIIAPDDNPGNKRWILKSDINVDTVTEKLDRDYGCDLPTALTAIGVVNPTQLNVDCDCIIASGTTVNVTDNITLHYNGGTFDGVAGGGTEILNIAGQQIGGDYNRYGANLTITGLTYANILWGYGVDSDGTDSTTGIKQINAAMTEDGGVIEWPSGDYSYSTVIDIENNVIWRGLQGSNYQTTDPKLEFTGSGVGVQGKEGVADTDSTRGIGIENMIIGTDGSETGQTCLLLESAKDCYLTNVALRPDGDDSIGLHLKAEADGGTYGGCYGNTFTNVRITGSEVYTEEGSGQKAFYLSGDESDGQCNTNIFINPYAIQVEDAYTIEASFNNTFIGSTAEKCTGRGIILEDAAFDNIFYSFYAENLVDNVGNNAWFETASANCFGNKVYGAFINGAYVGDAVIYNSNSYEERGIIFVGENISTAFGIGLVGGSGEYSDIEFMPAGQNKLRLRREAVTIASGVITPTRAYMTVATEAGAASDDLDTIATTNFKDGDIIYLFAVDGGDDVVVKDNTGNIQCGSDITIDNTRSPVTLIYNSNATAWCLLAPYQTN